MTGFRRPAAGHVVAFRRSCFATVVSVVALYGLAVAGAAEPAMPDHAIVTGFDRFYASADQDMVDGGLLLLGELNCTSCHRAEAAASEQISVRRAPLLGEVGSRVNPAWIGKFLADPQATKPGTTMPHVLAEVPESERSAAIERLTHYLVSHAPRPFVISGPDAAAVAEGESLFHRVGCVACHAPRRETTDVLMRTSVPLGILEDKYSISSLTAFLLDPLHVRPAGRMPQLPLSAEEASSIAQYLLKNTKAPAALNVAYYEGNFGGPGDLAKSKPVRSGNGSGFDLASRRRNDQFAFDYTGYLAIDQEGEYTFFTKSDDGSWLFVGETLVVDNGGTHAATEKSGKIKLGPGRHPLRVVYQQGGGEYSLQVEYQGPGTKRQRIPASRLTATAEPPPEQPAFVVDEKLAAEGKALFARLGCAACHQHNDGDAQVAAETAAPALAKLKHEGGCLSEQPGRGVPVFRLSMPQRAALSAALSAVAANQLPTRDDAQRVHATFTALNCYACHQRGETGGVEASRDAFFTADDKDLGDEGRLPPLLTGVGDKLQLAWLADVLTKAAVARPYMHARMPQFGAANVAHLAASLEKLDLVKPSAPQPADAPELAREAGHRLVGKNGLSCISCHMFYRHKSQGIQATDLSMMPQRLRQDWFYRYMLNPQQFRPGTRMPAAWPQGRAMRRDVLDADTDRQIMAIYTYLSDGKRAILPDGLIVTSMELIVGGEAVIYRNFIQGAGSRAIGVGYAEEANLAFDANELRLALLWQGRFIDASRHWSGRGQGFEPPLGDKIVTLPAGPPFAHLENEMAAWPKVPGRAANYQFQGYELDRLRRPTFLYRFGAIDIMDQPLPQETKTEKQFLRTLTFTAAEPAEKLWHRIAAGGEIQRIDDQTYRVGGQWTAKVIAPSGAKPVLRTVGGPELIVHVPLVDGTAILTIEYSW